MPRLTSPTASRAISRLRAVTAGEDGVAMIVAMGVLASLMVLSATVLIASQGLGNSTNTDSARKRAFEAAEAGLQATIYRLNMLGPTNGNCIGGPGETVQAPSGAACPAYSQDLGNGATFQSWTTTTLGAGGSCAGVAVQSGSVNERCVTAAGTVDGVTRRVQARVASYASAPVFPVGGVIGLTSFEISNTAHVYGAAGSNGKVKLSNDATTSSVEIGPAAPDVEIKDRATAGPITRRTSSQGPIVLAPVDPGNSATSSDDVRLTNAFASPKVSPFDSVSGNVEWDAAKRTLKLNDDAAVTLGGAIYNFCHLELKNNATITLASGARTAIFVDSKDRPGSSCTSDGKMSMSDSSAFVNNSPPPAGTSLAHDPTALQLYIVGQGDSKLVLNNNAVFYGTIYGPNTSMEIKNNVVIFGAVASSDVKISNNATITADPNAASIRVGGSEVYFRSAWRECLAAATTSDPSSGC